MERRFLVPVLLAAASLAACNNSTQEEQATGDPVKVTGNSAGGDIVTVGPPGPTGPAGPAGPQGETGPAGADSAVLHVFRIRGHFERTLRQYDAPGALDPVPECVTHPAYPYVAGPNEIAVINASLDGYAVTSEEPLEFYPPTITLAMMVAPIIDGVAGYYGPVPFARSTLPNGFTNLHDAHVRYLHEGRSYNFGMVLAVDHEDRSFEIPGFSGTCRGFVLIMRSEDMGPF